MGYYLESEEKKFVKEAIQAYLRTQVNSKNLGAKRKGKTAIVRKKRAYIKIAIFRRMLEKTGCRCCICHRPFFQLYHLDGNRTNNALNNLLPICSHHNLDNVQGLLNVERIQKRRRNMCCVCNKPFISIHHIDHDVSHVKEENLVLLCRECHIRYDRLSVKKMKAVRDNWFAFLDSQSAI